ncbi:MAG: hypothetical protein KC983_11815 [Phycisphaerales bacterium]|nr:hypothetical protein [Phycisphaerales bacterium]
MIVSTYSLSGRRRGSLNSALSLSDVLFALDVSTPASQPEFNAIAGILAWIWPGLGHFSLGQRRRGILISIGMLLLIGTGLLVGGFDCVDRREDKLWFIAQAGCGPIVFAADTVNQAVLKQGRPVTHPDRLKTISMGRPNEMGTLFIALAGLMNVIVILDATFFDPKRAAGKPKPEARRRADDA